MHSEHNEFDRHTARVGKNASSQKSSGDRSRPNRPWDVEVARPEPAEEPKSFAGKLVSFLIDRTGR